MKNRYKIEGLDCPNCAKTLEIKVNELKSVNAAKINFVKSYIEIESDNLDNAINDVIILAKKIEPNAKIIVNNQKIKKINKNLILDLTFLLVGLSVGLIALFVPMPNYLFWILYSLSALFMGYKTYYKAIQLLFKKTINENLLITLSVIGAALVGECMDSLMVIALYSIGKLLENLALNKSRKSLEKLTNLKPEQAVKLVDGQEQIVSPNEVQN